MTRTGAVLGCMLVVVVLAPGTALADPRGPGPDRPGAGGPGPGQGGPPPGAGFGPREIHQLGLSPEQFAKLDDLHDTFDAERRTSEEPLDQLHRELRDLWSAATPDETALIAKIRELGAVHEKLQIGGIRQQLGVLKILTEEQRARLRQLIAERPEPPRHGDRPGPPPSDSERRPEGAQRD